ncbi:MAG TPA: chloride channel protein [Solirubrobacterales bacterium]|nr:chloride channel protein [Solirubrobacterales bacterium]
MDQSPGALTPPPAPVPLSVRLRSALGGQSGVLAALALLIGAGAGLGAIVFRLLIRGFTELFSGHSDPSALGHFTNPHLAFLGPFVVLVVPVVGGLLYGPLVYRFAPEARGHGVPEVMLAVHSNQGRIRGRVPVVKSLASAICIGAGGSVGREGPIVQIGSAIGSGVGQVLRLPGQDLRLLVACGAAGGIGATFNAPIAGVFFALELILRDFQTRAFGIVVLSSVVATAVGRLAYGSGAFLHLPGFHVVSAVEYPLYALLGILAALAGVAFMRTLYGAEDFADDIWRGPAWLRPAAGGVLLGLLLLALPEMYGVGYPVLEGAIDGRYVLGLLLVFLLGKIVATSLTLAIGGSGGVFAPSLFMGAMLGSAFGLGAHDLLPASTAGAGAYGLVGMGALFAATGRAPITAVLIVFELTGDYSVILPLMLAVVVATAISRRLSADSIYTLKLRRRGIDIDRPAIGGPLAGLRIGEAMQPPPRALDPHAGLAEITSAFLAQGRSVLPVVDESGLLLGVLDARQVERLAAGAEEPDAAALAQDVPELFAGEDLTVAVSCLAEEDREAVPVLAPGTRRLVGWVEHRDLLRAYTEMHEPEAHPGGGRSARKAEESRRAAPVALVSGSEDP